MKKKIFIIIGILLIIIVCLVIYIFSKSSPSIGKITKCNTDSGIMYSLDFDAYDAGGLTVLNGKSISCNWAWGSSEECQNLPETNSCKTIYATPNNIYGEPARVTIEGLLTLMKYK